MSDGQLIAGSIVISALLVSLILRKALSMSTNAATLALAGLTAAVGRIGDDVRSTAAAIIAHINGEAGISADVLNDLAVKLNASADALEQVKLDGAAQNPDAPDAGDGSTIQVPAGDGSTTQVPAGDGSTTQVPAGDGSGLDTSGGTTATGTDVSASPEPGNADGAGSSDGASDGASDGSDSSGSGSDFGTSGSDLGAGTVADTAGDVPPAAPDADSAPVI